MFIVFQVIIIIIIINFYFIIIINTIWVRYNYSLLRLTIFFSFNYI